MNVKNPKIHIFTILLVLIICGNSFPIRVFDSMDITLGNIPVYMIALLFPPLWAGIAGLFSALVLSIYSGHFLFVPVFVLEALFLSLAVRRSKKIDPVILLALYWLLFGSVLSAFLYHWFLNLPVILIVVKMESLFLNSILSISAVVLILSYSPIQQQLPVRGLRFNNLFNIISSYLFLLVLALVFLVLNLESSYFMEREMEHNAELLQKSSKDLQYDIESYVAEHSLDGTALSSLIRADEHEELRQVLTSFFDHKRLDSSHKAALKDREGRVLIQAPESYPFLMRFNKSNESSGHFIDTYGDDVFLWIPSQKNYRNKGLLDSRLIISSSFNSSDWIIQGEITNEQIVLRQQKIIALILFLLSLAFILCIPVLKIISSRLITILDSLILQSSRNMYGLDDAETQKDWPESNIWELSHLSYRLKEVISHQKKATSLLNRQNLALSDMNAALIRSEENLRITLHSIADGVIVSDAEGCLLSINPVASRLSGYFPDETDHPLIRDFLVLKDEFTGEPYTDFLESVLQRGEVVDAAARYHLMGEGGKLSIVTLGAAPIRMNRNTEIRGAVIVIRDITESRELEDQLRQAQKMEVVGQLAGGIAHDFNNLLGGIQGMISVMKLDLEENCEPWVKLDEITKLIKRAADLTSKLLSFSRKGKMVSSSFDFHHIIQETVDLLQHSFADSIEIKSHLRANDSRIQGDPTEIQRVLMNLALNARDAMQEGGTLTLITANLTKGTFVETLTGRVQLVQDFLYLKVSDTGCGISDEIKKHIFEPFFSTKEPGNSSGLGLSAVYGSLLEHHGYISLNSKEGEGTVFSLYYPLAD